MARVTTRAPCDTTLTYRTLTADEPVVDNLDFRSGWTLSWPLHRGWPCTVPGRSRAGSGRSAGEVVTTARSSRRR